VARLKTNDEDARTVGSYERRNFGILSRRRHAVANTDKRMKHPRNMDATNVAVANIQETILVVDDI
jgi:hypothetical protein